MKLIIKACQICGNWYVPSSHHYHCPVCGSGEMMLNGKPQYVNVVSGRQVIKGEWTWQGIKARVERIARVIE